jgi:hypothetical protein
MSGTKGDRFPLTYQRAATSIVQCRSHLTKAEREASLAAEILSHLHPLNEAEGYSVMVQGLVRFREHLAQIREAFIQDVLAGVDDSLVTTSKGEGA